MKQAFTLLELLFSIVILSILASLTLSNYHSPMNKQHAIDAIISNIRYTQHLALSDHKHDFDMPKWQRALWTFKLEHCPNIGWFYTITSNQLYVTSHNHIDAAIDPSNNQPIYYRCDKGTKESSPRIFITKRYIVKEVNIEGGCNHKAISFDHLGRPYSGFTEKSTSLYANYMATPCHLTFTLENSENFTITILPETGFVYNN
jgi:prepilin-type N-terminal cleavage/methylation domain-containing protein